MLDSGENKFYAYIYLDPRKPGKFCYKSVCFLYEPFYVGKGHGNRYLKHLIKNKIRGLFQNKLKKILSDFSKQDLKNYIVLFRNNLTEVKAFEFEQNLIEEIGRFDFGTGPLANHTDGGEGTSGAIRSTEFKDKISKANKGQHFSEEIKRKMSQSHKGLSSPNQGKKLSEEHKKKIKISCLNREFSEELRDKLRQLRFGKKQSEKTKEKNRRAHLGRKVSDETKEKLRQANLGKKHSEESIQKMKNKTFSEECRKKISKAGLGRKFSEESKEKMRQAKFKNRENRKNEKMKEKFSDAPLFQLDIPKKSWLIFDTSWIAHASLASKAYNWMTCKRNGEGVESPSGHVFGSISKILSALRAFSGSLIKETDLIFVFDERPIETLEIFPEYKAGRNHIFNPVPDIKNLVSHLNCFHAYCPHTEADHVIATLAKELSLERQVFIVSADKDLWQLLDIPNVVLVPRADEKITLNDFNKKFGLNNPRSIALHKAIFGDPSDNIPKLEGRLERKIVSKYIDFSQGTPQDFYEILETCPKDMKQTTHDILLNNRAQVEKMFSITQLKTDIPYKLVENIGSKKDLLNFLHEFFTFSLDEKVNILF